MDKIFDIKNLIKHTIEQEASAISNLTNYVTDDFSKAVELIYHSKGRVIITGIGKVRTLLTKLFQPLIPQEHLLSLCMLLMQFMEI